MTMHAVKCRDCGRTNRMPPGAFVEARCGRCESALTTWTVVAGVLRHRGLSRTVQVGLATGVLVAMFASDVAAWWEAGPFRLDAQIAEAERSSPAGPSLATDPGE